MLPESNLEGAEVILAVKVVDKSQVNLPLKNLADYAGKENGAVARLELNVLAPFHNRSDHRGPPRREKSYSRPDPIVNP